MFLHRLSLRQFTGEEFSLCLCLRRGGQQGKRLIQRRASVPFPTGWVPAEPRTAAPFTAASSGLRFHASLRFISTRLLLCYLCSSVTERRSSLVPPCVRRGMKRIHAHRVEPPAQNCQRDEASHAPSSSTENGAADRELGLF